MVTCARRHISSNFTAYCLFCERLGIHGSDTAAFIMADVDVVYPKNYQAMFDLPPYSASSKILLILNYAKVVGAPNKTPRTWNHSKAHVFSEGNWTSVCFSRYSLCNRFIVDLYADLVWLEISWTYFLDYYSLHCDIKIFWWQWWHEVQDKKYLDYLEKIVFPQALSKLIETQRKILSKVAYRITIVRSKLISAQVRKIHKHNNIIGCIYEVIQCTE